ncbi:LOW QUALITY PROTEIN: DNA polymerase III PolC-type-like [Saccostrea cucullata]|uniref:LOW QUALITY PROTEIN: DNA polymerase III PolC-type-like n=1 Tax=Saccostrea cuccullata TaxID=36930 RepID=UPI002ED6248E
MDIPLPSTRQLSRPVDAPASPDTIIVADLETTGFSNSSSIIQIAAAPLYSDDSFNRFVQPANGFIPPSIVKLTGIEMHGMQMYYLLNPVPSCGERQAIAEFAEWLSLSRFPSPLIVAHNAQFDARILVSCFTRHGLTDMIKRVVGFSDTVKFFKKVHPNQPSYKLQDLAKSLAPEFDSVNAHNAENDVSMLKILLKNTPKAEESLSELIFSTDYVIANNEKLSNKNKNIGSFHDIITSNVLTKGQSSTLAAHGFQANHLKLALQRGGRDGLYEVLKGKLKSVNTVIDKIISFYEV